MRSTNFEPAKRGLTLQMKSKRYGFTWSSEMEGERGGGKRKKKKKKGVDKERPTFFFFLLFLFPARQHSALTCLSPPEHTK